MSNNKMSVFVGAVVIEMINIPFSQKIHAVAKFSATLCGHPGSARFFEDCAVGFPEKTRRGAQKGDHRIPGCCLDKCAEQVVRVLCYDAGGERTLVGSLEQTSGGWHQQYELPTSAGDVDKLLQKHWERQENRESMKKHGCVVRPTMFVASLDIKTAFDDVRPEHVASLMEKQNMHRWLLQEGVQRRQNCGR